MADAFAHCKFIGLSEGGRALMAAAGLDGRLGAGCLALATAGDAVEFVAACAPLRHWVRELALDVDATV